MPGNPFYGLPFCIIDWPTSDSLVDMRDMVFAGSDEGEHDLRLKDGGPLEEEGGGGEGCLSCSVLDPNPVVL